MSFLIFSVLAVLITSFLCSLSEATILSVNIHAPSTDKPSAGELLRAERWKKLRKNISKPIAAILILNTLANTGGSVVASSAFIEHFGPDGMWIFSLLMTILILFFAEIMPKVIGVEYNHFLMRYLITPLSFLTWFFAPLILLSEWFAKPFKRKDSGNLPTVTSSEIIAYASAARARNAIDLEQESIITNAIRLKKTTVRKIMIPRDSIHYIINGLSLEDNEKRFGGVMEKTRYPVCREDDIDTIIGTINHKKFEHYHGDQATDYTSMMRDPVYVNENMTLLQALKTMRNHKQHIIFVRGNDNTLSGLLTLEDIMDELVDVSLPD